MNDDLDLSQYTRAPKLDVASAVAVGVSLLSTIPPAPPPPIKRAARTLRRSLVDLQGAWKQRDRVEKRSDARPLDVLADNTMGRLYSRVEAYAGLPADQYPLAPRAAWLLQSLFPDGLEFLKGTYQTQWAETQKRLDRIDEEKLSNDLDRIAGPEFLAEVRRVHALYGEAVGVTKAREKVDSTSLSEPLRVVSSAITTYAIQLVAVCTDTDVDAATREAARRALAPLDEYRAGAARREGRRGIEEAQDVAVPEVPA